MAEPTSTKLTHAFDASGRSKLPRSVGLRIPLLLLGTAAQHGEHAPYEASSSHQTTVAFPRAEKR